MDFILLLALAFLAGVLVKTVDWLDDDLKSKTPIKFVLALAYGLLVGYLISASSFSMIFLAALVAQVFARKIDTDAHRLGFLLAAVSMISFGLPEFDFPLFLFFLVLAFLDEVEYFVWFGPLAEYRPFLKLGALVPAVWGVWDYFAGIIAFDAGYLLFAFFVSRNTKR